MTEDHSVSRPAYLTVAVLVLVLTAFSWGLAPALYGVHQNWTGMYGHFAHGYLVLVMAIWLVWRSWRDSPVIPVSQGWLALPILLLLMVAVSASMALSIDTITQSLLPLILLSALVATAGWEYGRRYFWPISFVYSALPLWWVINTPLQKLTAAVADLLVSITNVPAYIEGNRFHLPAGTVEVAAGCSGLSFLNSAVALGMFQGLMFLKSWPERLKLLGMAVSFGLLANWLRVYSLIAIAYATDMRHYLIRVDHLTYGWVVFLVCMWPVFWYGARLERAGCVPARQVRARSAGCTHTWRLLLSAVLVGLMLLIPRALQIYGSKGSSEYAAGLTALDGRGVADQVRVDQRSVISGASGEQVTFGDSGLPVWLFRATPGLNFDLGNWPVDGTAVLHEEWKNSEGNIAKVEELQGMRYVQYRGKYQGIDALLRTGSSVAGYAVQSSLDVKVATLKGKFTRRRDAMLWVLWTRCDPDCESAANRLDDWMKRHSELVGARQ